MTLKSATRVCYNCKARKRKCSKDLPSCRLCTRLKLQCLYEYESTTTWSTPDTQDQGLWGNHIQGGASSANPFLGNRILAFPLALTGSETCSYVLDILIGLGENIPAIISTYFRTIDIWLPVISRNNVQTSFQDIRAKPSAELGALLMCMRMIITVPTTGGCDSMRSPIYTQAKSLCSSQLSTGKPSIELVQAGLLLTLYEHGHGMVDAASMSMAAIARLGFRMVVECQKAGFDIYDTELGNLWIGIVMIDRYMNLGAETGEIFLSTTLHADRNWHFGLPIDPEATPMGATQTLASPRNSASSPSTRLGPFCRAAEASELLGRVLGFVTNSDPSTDDKNFKLIDRDLQDLALSLLKQATHGWEECCAAIGLCFSALLTLHNNASEIPSTSLQSLMASRAAIRIIIDISRRFNEDRAHIDLPALALPATFCAYRAATLYIHASEEQFLGQQWNSNMECLKNALQHFSMRWNIGRGYLECIDRAIAEKRNELSLIPGSNSIDQFMPSGV